MSPVTSSVRCTPSSSAVVVLDSLRTAAASARGSVDCFADVGDGEAVDEDTDETGGLVAATVDDAPAPEVAGKRLPGSGPSVATEQEAEAIAEAGLRE